MNGLLGHPFCDSYTLVTIFIHIIKDDDLVDSFRFLFR